MVTRRRACIVQGLLSLLLSRIFICAVAVLVWSISSVSLPEHRLYAPTSLRPRTAACMRCFFLVLSRLSWNTKSAIQELSIHTSSFLPFLASGPPQKVEARIPSSAPPQPTFFIEIDNVSLFSHGLFELSTLVSSPSPTSRCILSGCSLLATTSAL